MENRVLRQNQVKIEAEKEKSILSTSWADEVEDYFECDDVKVEESNNHV